MLKRRVLLITLILVMSFIFTSVVTLAAPLTSTYTVTGSNVAMTIYSTGRSQGYDPSVAGIAYFNYASSRFYKMASGTAKLVPGTTDQYQDSGYTVTDFNKSKFTNVDNYYSANILWFLNNTDVEVQQLDLINNTTGFRNPDGIVDTLVYEGILAQGNGDLKGTFVVKLIQGADGTVQNARTFWRIENISDTNAVYISTSHNVDTYVYTTDFAPFKVPGWTQTFSTSIAKVQIPTGNGDMEAYYDAKGFLDADTNPYSEDGTLPPYLYGIDNKGTTAVSDDKAMIIKPYIPSDPFFRGESFERPIKFGMGYYYQVSTLGHNIDYDIGNAYLTGNSSDSGHSSFWGVDLLLPGETKYFGIEYGSSTTTDFSDGDLGLNMFSSLDSTTYEPGVGYSDMPMSVDVELMNHTLSSFNTAKIICLVNPQELTVVDSNWVRDTNYDETDGRIAYVLTLPHALSPSGYYTNNIQIDVSNDIGNVDPSTYVDYNGEDYIPADFEFRAVAYNDPANVTNSTTSTGEPGISDILYIEPKPGMSLDGYVAWNRNSDNIADSNEVYKNLSVTMSNVTSGSTIAPVSMTTDAYTGFFATSAISDPSFVASDVQNFKFTVDKGTTIPSNYAISKVVTKDGNNVETVFTSNTNEVSFSGDNVFLNYSKESVNGSITFNVFYEPGAIVVARGFIDTNMNGIKDTGESYITADANSDIINNTDVSDQTVKITKNGSTVANAGDNQRAIFAYSSATLVYQKTGYSISTTGEPSYSMDLLNLVPQEEPYYYDIPLIAKSVNFAYSDDSLSTLYDANYDSAEDVLSVPLATLNLLLNVEAYEGLDSSGNPMLLPDRSGLTFTVLSDPENVLEGTILADKVTTNGEISTTTSNTTTTDYAVVKVAFTNAPSITDTINIKVIDAQLPEFTTLTLVPEHSSVAVGYLGTFKLVADMGLSTEQVINPTLYNSSITIDNPSDPLEHIAQLVPTSNTATDTAFKGLQEGYVEVSITLNDATGTPVTATGSILVTRFPITATTQFLATPENLEVGVGRTANVTYTLQFSPTESQVIDARAVTETIADTTIATVDTGVVSGVAINTTTLNAVLNTDTTKTDTVNINVIDSYAVGAPLVVAPLDSIFIQQSASGTTTKPFISFIDSDKNGVYTPGIDTLVPYDASTHTSSTGIIMSLSGNNFNVGADETSSTGSTTIDVTYEYQGETYTGSTTIIVEPEGVTSRTFKVIPEYTFMVTNRDKQFSVQVTAVTPNGNVSYILPNEYVEKYFTDDESILTINTAGLAHSIAQGEATVNATLYTSVTSDSLSAATVTNANVIVVNNASEVTLEITPDYNLINLGLTAGYTYVINVNGTPIVNPNSYINANIDDTTIAKFNTSSQIDIVKGIRFGRTNLNASVIGLPTITDNARIYVVDANSRLEFNPAEISLFTTSTGGTSTVLMSNGSSTYAVAPEDLTFSGIDTAIATQQAVAAGDTNITVLPVATGNTSLDASLNDALTGATILTTDDNTDLDIIVTEEVTHNYGRDGIQIIPSYIEMYPGSTPTFQVQDIYTGDMIPAEFLTFNTSNPVVTVANPAADTDTTFTFDALATYDGHTQPYLLTATLIGVNETDDAPVIVYPADPSTLTFSIDDEFYVLPNGDDHSQTQVTLNIEGHYSIVFTGDEYKELFNFRPNLISVYSGRLNLADDANLATGEYANATRVTGTSGLSMYEVKYLPQGGTVKGKVELFLLDIGPLQFFSIFPDYVAIKVGDEVALTGYLQDHSYRSQYLTTLEIKRLIQEGVITYTMIHGTHASYENGMLTGLVRGEDTATYTFNGTLDSQQIIIVIDENDTYEIIPKNAIIGKTESFNYRTAFVNSNGLPTIDVTDHSSILPTDNNVAYVIGGEATGHNEGITTIVGTFLSYQAQANLIVTDSSNYELVITPNPVIVQEDGRIYYTAAIVIDDVIYNISPSDVDITEVGGSTSYDLYENDNFIINKDGGFVLGKQVGNGDVEFHYGNLSTTVSVIVTENDTVAIANDSIITLNNGNDIVMTPGSTTSQLPYEITGLAPGQTADVVFIVEDTNVAELTVYTVNDLANGNHTLSNIEWTTGLNPNSTKVTAYIVENGNSDSINLVKNDNVMISDIIFTPASASMPINSIDKIQDIVNFNITVTLSDGTVLNNVPITDFIVNNAASINSTTENAQYLDSEEEHTFKANELGQTIVEFVYKYASNANSFVNSFTIAVIEPVPIEILFVPESTVNASDIESTIITSAVNIPLHDNEVLKPVFKYPTSVEGVYEYRFVDGSYINGNPSNNQMVFSSASNASYVAYVGTDGNVNVKITGENIALAQFRAEVDYTLEANNLHPQYDSRIFGAVEIIVGNSFTFIVQDQYGNVIPNANVTGPNVNGTTDVNGKIIVSSSDVVLSGVYTASLSPYTPGSHTITSVDINANEVIIVITDTVVIDYDYIVNVLDVSNNGITTANVDVNGTVYLTDVNGEADFTLSNPLVAGNIITVSKPGYITQHYTVTAADVSSGVINVVLQDDIISATSIKFVVKYQDGTLAPNATIEIAGIAHSVVTDANGELVIDPAAGIVGDSVVATMTGYNPSNPHTVVSGDIGQVVILTLGNTIPVGGNDITFIVKYNSGALAPGASIKFNGATYAVNADSNGEILIDPANTYVGQSVVASMSGYNDSAAYTVLNSDLGGVVTLILGNSTSTGGGGTGGGGGGGSTKSKVTVIYKDVDGNELKKISSSEEIGSSFTHTAENTITVDGKEYNLVNNPVVTITVNGTSSKNVITYTYSLKGSINNNFDFKSGHPIYVKGYGNGTVKPSSDITRAEAAAMIYRLLEVDVNTSVNDNAYSDVVSNAWYADAVNYLSAKNIILGYPNGTFKPNDEISREELATLLSRFSNIENSSVDSNFNDISSSRWSYNAISITTLEGWFNGYPDGSFKPTNDITRAETITAINRLVDRERTNENVPESFKDFYSDLSDTFWAYGNIYEASVEHEASEQHK